MIVIYPSRIKTSNLGDILINVLLIRELSKYGRVYVDGAIPSMEELVKINNDYNDNIRIVKGIPFLSGRPVFRWVNMLHLLPKVSVVFDPPGAYSEGRKRNKFYFKFLKYYGRAKVLSFFQGKVMRWGVSLGPFSDKGYKLQAKLSAVYGDTAVRDSKNYERLLKERFRNLSLIDDLSFLYKPGNFTGLLGSGTYGKDYIVLSFRAAIEGKAVDHEYLNRIILKIKQLITDRSSKDHTILLAYQVREDLEAIQLIQKELGKFQINAGLVDRQLDLAGAISLYFNASLVITNRLHVALLSFLNGTPAMVITDTRKHHKLVNIYHDLGLDELMIDCDLPDTLCLDLNKNDEYVMQFNDAAGKKSARVEQYIMNRLKPVS